MIITILDSDMYLLNILLPPFFLNFQTLVSEASKFLPMIFLAIHLLIHIGFPPLISGCR